MNTSRVPGLTRNSGWQALAAQRAEGGRQQRESTSTELEPGSGGGARRLAENGSSTPAE